MFYFMFNLAKIMNCPENKNKLGLHCTSAKRKGQNAYSFSLSKCKGQEKYMTRFHVFFLYLNYSKTRKRVRTIKAS